MRSPKKRVVYKSKVHPVKVLPGVEIRLGVQGEIRRVDRPTEYDYEDYLPQETLPDPQTEKRNYISTGNQSQSLQQSQPYQNSWINESAKGSKIDPAFHINELVNRTKDETPQGNYEFRSNLDEKDDIIQELSCQVAILIGVNKALRFRLNKPKESDQDNLQQGDLPNNVDVDQLHNDLAELNHAREIIQTLEDTIREKEIHHQDIEGR